MSNAGPISTVVSRAPGQTVSPIGAASSWSAPRRCRGWTISSTVQRDTSRSAPGDRRAPSTTSEENRVTHPTQDATGKNLIPRPDTVTTGYLRDILDEYYMEKWNPNKDTVASVVKWRDWPLVVRMPDVKKDFTIHIDAGVVQHVTVGLPERPRILCIMLSETM